METSSPRTSADRHKRLLLQRLGGGPLPSRDPQRGLPGAVRRRIPGRGTELLVLRAACRPHPGAHGPDHARKVPVLDQGPPQPHPRGGRRPARGHAPLPGRNLAPGRGRQAGGRPLPVPLQLPLHPGLPTPPGRPLRSPSPGCPRPRSSAAPSGSASRCTRGCASGTPPS